MQYAWDEEKCKVNIEKRKLDFAAIQYFGWDDAVIFEDIRRDYSEARFVAYGYIHARLMVVVYTMRGDTVRIISLRKANKREVTNYGQT